MSNVNNKGAKANITFVALALRAMGAFTPPARLTKTIQLRVSAEWLEAVDGFVKEARDRGAQLSRSDVIRMATEQWVRPDGESGGHWPEDNDLKAFFEEHHDLLAELLAGLDTDVRR